MPYQNKDKPDRSNCNGDISHIKDSGTESSDAHIHKINDSSFVKNAIYQISSASSQNEYKGDGCDQVDN